MGRYVKSETVLFKKLYRDNGYNDIDEFSRLICWLRNIVSKEYYSLPYFAIRNTGIDFIFRTHSSRVSYRWVEILKVEVSVSAFTFYPTSAKAFHLKFRDLDYSTIQAMKAAFAVQGLLVSTSSK